MERYISRRGFTLVELLVVISIVALLMAFLLPALSKARYQANLIVCLAQTRQLAIGMLTYSVEFDQRWPLRKHVDYDVSHVYPMTLIGYSNNNGHKCQKHRQNNWDNRPLYRPYMGLDLFACPLAPPQPGDFEDLNWNQVTMSSYEIFAGHKVHGSCNTNEEIIWEMADGSPMKVWSQGIYRGETTAILMDTLYKNVSYTYAVKRPLEWFYSHPRAGLTRYNMGTSAWWSGPNWPGPVERNTAFADGHARTVHDMIAGDPRYFTLPYNHSSRSRLLRADAE